MLASYVPGARQSRFAKDAMEQPAITILSYDAPPPRCDPHDPAAPAAAAALAGYLREHLAEATVEHVGSTAAPGCAGKGVIDLALLYPEGQLTATRERIDALGFQRQTTRDPFPEERPMRTGAFDFQGRRYLVHVHVIAAGSTEAEDLRYFRDCLRADAELRSAYVAFKKKILASGVSDSVDYAIAKGEFIRQCLGH
jgi:GrpB-like predicted nucleotidyltransferase (UPF0157 family)